jgi:hypothetical protein
MDAVGMNSQSEDTVSGGRNRLVAAWIDRVVGIAGDVRLLSQQHPPPQRRWDRIEHVIGRSLDREPRSDLEFRLELIGSPPGVSRKDAKVLEAADVVRIKRYIDESHIGRCRPPGLRRLDSRAIGDTDRSLRLHGSALKDPCRRCQEFAPRRQMVLDIHVERTVEHDTHRPIMIVIKEENHGAEEVGVGKNR